MDVKLSKTIAFVLTLILSACGTPQGNTQVPKVETNLQFTVRQESQLIESVGAPYEITVDNCNGARDSEKIEERSKKYLTELNLEVSNKVAAEVGGNIEVAKVMVSDEIGLALGIRIGTETESRSSVKIVTPAGQKTVAHLQWEEVWTSGTVAVSRPDGTYVDVLPFSVLNSLTLEQLDSQTINCETGAIVENGSTAQISTPEIPAILPTPAPVSIGYISVSGNSSEGTKFTATQAGIYTFKYISGSYSTYPASKTPPAGILTWLTAIRVFKNRPVEWNGIAISSSSDYRAVDYAYYASASEVENIAKGSVLSISLLQGDYLIFVAVDELPYYSDNPGEVVFEVLYTPNQ
ncbi:MAG: hypothetical protein KJZ72_18505 [Anaerolineales bacterium]|nr:hypothetical protein [Anaerolineales bacterium]